jgi:hypothetical protein
METLVYYFFDICAAIVVACVVLGGARAASDARNIRNSR